MTFIKKVAVVGASGNFGTPITAALREAGFEVTIITRPDSTKQHPAQVPVVRTEYTLEHLTQAFAGQHAVVCVVGPGGIGTQTTLIDAAEAAGVSRFIVNDFGWGPDFRGLPEFDAIRDQRHAAWNHAREKANANPSFTWTGISTGNPIEWASLSKIALAKFPLMGFDVANHKAIIYDDGTEAFTGTTLEGIGQSVVGVMRHPEQTANRFVKVLSIETSQARLLEAFKRTEYITGQKWEVGSSTSEALMTSGKAKFQSQTSGWILELVVAQLFDKDQARSLLAPSWAESDSPLLGVNEEAEGEVVSKVLELSGYERKARAVPGSAKSAEH